jgi:hypothetical protein
VTRKVNGRYVTGHVEFQAGKCCDVLKEGVRLYVWIYVVAGKQLFQRCGINLAPILPRRRRQMLFERPLKMRLVGKSGFQRHIGNQLAAA